MHSTSRSAEHRPGTLCSSSISTAKLKIAICRSRSTTTQETGIGADFCFVLSRATAMQFESKKPCIRWLALTTIAFQSHQSP